MSEIVAEKRTDYDFLKPLTFVFEDPQWIQKLLMGALFSLAGIVLIGIFFVNGYLARLARNVVDGLERPLPEWTDLGDMFGEGAMLFVAALLYMIPVLSLGLIFFPFSVLANIDNPATQILGGGVLVILTLVMVPIAFATAVWIPAALLHAAVRRDFRAAFEFRTIAAFLRNNALNYLLAYLDWLVARMAAPLGLALCCVGIFVTAFWSLTVGAHAFAQTYRLSQKP